MDFILSSSEGHKIKMNINLESLFILLTSPSDSLHKWDVEKSTEFQPSISHDYSTVGKSYIFMDDSKILAIKDVYYIFNIRKTLFKDHIEKIIISRIVKTNLF